MAKTPAIRLTTESDQTGLMGIYPEAFPEEDLRPLVHDLLKDDIDTLSLCVPHSSGLLGHVVFTFFADAGVRRAGALLGPLAVHPDHQRIGLGSGLVHSGLAELADCGVRQVFVLGDPKYYSRFGFEKETAVQTPYSLPEKWADAWQSMPLEDRARLTPGPCKLPSAWMKPELW